MPVYDLTDYCKASADNIEAAKAFLHEINAQFSTPVTDVQNEAREMIARAVLKTNADILSGDSRVLSVLAFILNDEVFANQTDDDPVELSDVAYAHAQSHRDANRLHVLSNAICFLPPEHPVKERLSLMIRRYRELFLYRTDHPAE